MPRRSFPADAALSTWTAPDGWAHRRFERAGAGRGRLLFLGGRADSIEKYLEALDEWHDRGWTVAAFDWRGQGGSGRTGTGDVGHLDDFAVLVRDLAAFWAQWRRDGEPCVVVAHSTGGYLALAALVGGAIDPAALVLVAPMLGLRNPLGAWIGGGVARLIAGRGDLARAAWRERTVARAVRARQRRLTHDPSRFDDERWWYEHCSALRLGPPSWAWIVEAFAATAALRADPRLAAVATPVQLLVADHDRLVDSRAARAVAARLPHGELHRFGRDTAHEILREADPVRNHALALIDAFLDRHAPA
ncbi:alpha/beta fold hydrolase [Sphingomonas rubra]|uniref:Lysophospholipase n=1 Tax=Sphingomonas rubra TaxID=634430 RepID=A0A1I5UE72_9SPHN|nr:alpha/beta hydrolase [Sphingomonas rubra]SFP93580.1 lysophospholipase [Sphingomonas rubra]